MKVITMTAWRRPDYFSQVIQSIENAEGFADYHLIVSIDGGYWYEATEMIRILRESTIEDYTISIPNKNLGCAGNTYYVLSKGFEKADRVIHLEDDTILHPQALKWFEENLSKYEDDERIFSISGYVNGELNSNSLDGDWTESNIVGLRDDFNCWGWATWRRVWDGMKENLFGIVWKEGFNEHNCGYGEDFLNCVMKDDKGSWAWVMRKYWRKNRFEIAPHTSFMQNIGLERGMWATKEVFEFKVHTDWFKPQNKVLFPLDHFFVEDYLEALS